MFADLLFTYTMCFSTAVCRSSMLFALWELRVDAVGVGGGSLLLLLLLLVLVLLHMIDD
jgi:hypothetical protein